MNPIQVYTDLQNDEVHVGDLYMHRRGNRESATFSYAPRYLAHPLAYAIDPELALIQGSQQTRVGQSLFGAFSDSSPDRWGRTLINRRERMRAAQEHSAGRSVGEQEYLLGVRDDLRAGALRLKIGEGPFLAQDAIGVPDLIELPDLLALATLVERDDASLIEVERLVRVGSSLGGARPKAHVKTNKGRIAIAKFPSAASDTWNVMAWEKVAYELARNAGINVSDTTLIQIEGRSVLVIDRFDRNSDGDRVGYLSAMSMLEASDGQQRSYLEIAEVIETHSVQVNAELEELWRRIVFSILISNTDDHLRNHGFLHVRGDSWRLSPAFDMNPNPATGLKFLSTSIDGSDGPATIDAAIKVAPYFRLSEDAALTVLSEVKEAVEQWRNVAARIGLGSSEIESMEPAFSQAQ